VIRVLPLPPAAMFVLAVLATLAWLVMLARVALATRTRPVVSIGPRSDFGPETPAVVDLVTGDWRLCRTEAASATLLDLAARRVLNIEEIGPQLSLVRLRRNVEIAELRPYERMVLEHVTALAVDGVVATGALAEGARHLDRWWKRFHREVIAESRQLGLSQPRWSRKQTTMLTFATALPGTAVALWIFTLAFTPTHDADPVGAGVMAGLVLAGVLRMLLEKLNKEQGTDAGAVAAGRWLGVADHLAASGGFARRPAAAVTIWGRPLAYAAALGLAPVAVSSLPVSKAARDTRAWSDYGGMWHPVDVRYGGRGLARLFWGIRWTTAVQTAVVTAFFGCLLPYAALYLGMVFLGLRIELSSITAVLTIGVAVGAAQLGLALLDASSRATVEGQVVRCRQRERTDLRFSNSTVYWIAIDDGRHQQVRAYATDVNTWQKVREGDIVRAVIGRRLGWIYQMQVQTPSRHRAHPDAEATEARAKTLADVVRGVADHVPADTRRPPTVEPWVLVTADDLGRILGQAFGPAAPVALNYDKPAGSGLAESQLSAAATADEFGFTGCRYRSGGAQVTVDVYTAAGRRGTLVLQISATLADGGFRALRKTGGAGMVWPDTVAVAIHACGGFLIRVSSPHGPPGIARMSDLGRAAAARLRALA